MDIEKVIKGLECCRTGDFETCINAECPYVSKSYKNVFVVCRYNLMSDAMELLKMMEKIRESFLPG